MYHIKIMDTHDKEIILDGEEIVVIAGEAGGANGVIDADEATIAQVIAESPRLMRAARRAMQQLENTIWLQPCDGACPAYGIRMLTRADWIDKRERLPELDEIDPTGCVLAWHVYNGMMITGAQNVGENPYITHWLPALAGPEERERDT